MYVEILNSNMAIFRGKILKSRLNKITRAGLRPDKISAKELILSVHINEGRP